jgi:two-component system response regulator AlgR
MAAMKVLIADDEPLARERLAALLAELDGVECVGAAADGHEAVEMVGRLRPDVVLLDIAMPGLDGLGAARAIGALEAPPAIVFCTAYDQHALSAFDAAAADYVLKPVRRERLEAALAKARKLVPPAAARPGTAADGPRSHLCARLRGSLRRIPIEDVRYLQAEEKYVVVHHVHGEDLVEDSLKQLEAEYGERFVRIHRNCLVAREELRELRRLPDGRVHAVLRSGGPALEVSRRCLPALRERLRAG